MVSEPESWIRISSILLKDVSCRYSEVYVQDRFLCRFYSLLELAQGVLVGFVSQFCLSLMVQWPIVCLLTHCVWSPNLITWPHVQEVAYLLMTYANYEILFDWHKRRLCPSFITITNAQIFCFLTHWAVASTVKPWHVARTMVNISHLAYSNLLRFSSCLLGNLNEDFYVDVSSALVNQFMHHYYLLYESLLGDFMTQLLRLLPWYKSYICDSIN